MVKALEENPHLDDVSDYTNDSGEGRWTVEEAIELGVPMPVISASLFARFASRQKSSPTMQAVAALRGQFGGHQVMTIAEGEELRRQTGAEGSTHPAPAAAREKESMPDHPSEADVEASTAGPSSGTGSTGGGAPGGGPTSGSEDTSS
jgi:6-phosphogluconate dehydrogenase